MYVNVITKRYFRIILLNLLCISTIQILSCKESMFLKKELPKEYSLEVDSKYGKAIFAGGCFWCVEAFLQELDGVKSVISGYTGGKQKKALYSLVSSGATKHIESVLVVFDESKITYKELLEVFWKNIDPTQHDGQFYDIGLQYTTGIFTLDEKQKDIALKSKNKLENSKIFTKPIATKILDATVFYPAEEYHQDYYKKSPSHYNSYKKASGRDDFKRKAWKDKKFPW